MSIDKSLRRKNTLARSRNVLTRGERIKVLKDEERWPEGRSPYNLPKVRVLKIVVKKAKKAKEEEGAARPFSSIRQRDLRKHREQRVHPPTERPIQIRKALSRNQRRDAE